MATTSQVAPASTRPGSLIFCPKARSRSRTPASASAREACRLAPGLRLMVIMAWGSSCDRPQRKAYGKHQQWRDLVDVDPVECARRDVEALHRVRLGDRDAQAIGQHAGKAGHP